MSVYNIVNPLMLVVRIPKHPTQPGTHISLGGVDITQFCTHLSIEADVHSLPVAHLDLVGIGLDVETKATLEKLRFEMLGPER